MQAQAIRQQLMTMLTMQDAMNTKVHPEWQQQNYEWYRAIWIESAELMDHFGWKWWKKQQPDMDQSILELIDIWHFGLSIRLTEGKSLALIAEDIESEVSVQKEKGDFLKDIESFVALTLTHRRFDVVAFKQLMVDVDLSFDQLYRRYVGKNILNFFRQDHGYREGSYTKIWHGREDNEHLVEVLSELDASVEGFEKQVYQALKDRYPT